MTVEEEVRAVAAAFETALIGNDAHEVASFMRDDWVYVNEEGIVPKATVIGRIASGQLVHHTMQGVGAERVARVGESVIITRRKTSSGTWDGVPYTADEWISEVYVHAEGRWRCAFSHKTVAGGDLEQEE